MKTKTFDCVQAKYDAQLRVYDQIRGMTAEQQLDYFRRAAQSDSPVARKFRGITARGRTAEVGTAARATADERSAGQASAGTPADRTVPPDQNARP